MMATMNGCSPYSPALLNFVAHVAMIYTMIYIPQRDLSLLWLLLASYSEAIVLLSWLAHPEVTTKRVFHTSVRKVPS
jgi:hypothetical protein